MMAKNDSLTRQNISANQYEIYRSGRDKSKCSEKQRYLIENLSS